MLVLIIVIGELEYVWIYKEDHKNGFDRKNPLGIIGKIYKKVIKKIFGKYESYLK